MITKPYIFVISTPNPGQAVKSDIYSSRCYRPHTTVKNAKNMKSVSQAKLPYFEEIFKL